MKIHSIDNAHIEQLGLIPAPVSLIIHEGFFLLSDVQPLLIYSHAYAQSEITVFIEQMQQNTADTGEKLTCKTSNNEENAQIRITCDNTIVHNEGYSLIVDKKGIEIVSRTPCGAFYGLQTLRQMLMTHNTELPFCRIDDEPAYEWRGLMIDTSRSFYSVFFIKKMIDALSFHKLNRFHWHLTDDQGWRIPIPSFPLLTEIGSTRLDHRFTWDPERSNMYTHDEIREVVAYAQARHVMVIPEIETPGHASAVLASYPNLGCTGGPYNVEDRFGIFKEVLCAGNDEVFPLFEAVFDTVCELFPSPYIHIGGDECPRERWNECPRCKKRIADEKLENTDELQSWITVRFAQMVEKRGKIPIGWDEVIDGTERLGLPKNVIVQSWRGIEGGNKASALGHKVIMSPLTNGCYLDYKQAKGDEEPGAQTVITVADSYAYSPISNDMTDEQKKYVLGGQGNLWTEFIYASKIAEYMLFPRLCAISESLWLEKSQKDFNSFACRLRTHKRRLDALDILYYKGILS